MFENKEIDIQSLPDIESGAFQQLDRNYLKVSYIGNAIFFFILLMILIGANFMSEIHTAPIVKWGLIAFWLFWLILSFAFIKMGYGIRGYVLRERDMVHRRGVIFRNLTTIPFNRVQHCEVSQGPIQRLFDLHTLQIFTAGGSNSDLSIPGLKGGTAQKIKEYIINKTGLGERKNPSHPESTDPEEVDHSL